jgi:hypothetical protein
MLGTQGTPRAAWRAAVAPVVATLLATLALPGIARGDELPSITAGPAITGAPVVGATLDVAAEWTGQPPPKARYRWYRCPPEGGECARIETDNAPRYDLIAADAGRRIVVALELRNRAGAVEKQSPPTDVVAAARPSPNPQPTPTPTPTPTPRPTPTPAPTGTNTTTATGFNSVEPQPRASATFLAPTSPAPLPSTVGVARPAFLRPFPVVRIRGYFVARGVRVTLLSVRGPRSARIRARCAGSGCPVRAIAVARAPARLRAFERFLPTGTVIRIWVLSGTRVGKYVRFTIRTRLAPSRADRCLMPGRRRPVRCPS